MSKVIQGNPTVSNTLLKALGAPSRSREQISTADWTHIRRAAVGVLRYADMPLKVFKEVASSFELADRITAGKYKDKFSALLGGELKDLARRQASLRQVDPSDWNNAPGGLGAPS